jgi:hypothetical protein
MGMLFNDTPITRASIENLPIEQLDQFVQELQVRRLKAYTVYQAAQEAKYEKQLNSTQEHLDKRLEQFAKKLVTVDKGLSDLEKYALEILTARMALGHDISPQTKSK